MKLDDLKQLSEVYDVVIYDGVCMLCDKFITKVAQLDHTNKIRFIAYQSVDDTSLSNETVWLVRNSKFYSQSDVILKLNERLQKPLRFSSILHYMPQSLRTMAYKVIARNRYSWFGEKQSCDVYNPEVKQRILE